MNTLLLFIFLFLFSFTSSKSCLGIDGKEVDWWVQLIFPNTFSNGFGYMDSRASIPQFEIHPQKADSIHSALTRTLLQINHQNLQTIAWNDQWPTGQTSSSKAHSKGVIAFDDDYANGFYFGHSIPQYPAFIGGYVNNTISSNQSIYGQHVICITFNSDQLRDHLNRILPIKPYFYARNIKNETEYTKIVSSHQVPQPDYKSTFTYQNYSINGTLMQFIYKNGAVNASIFEDGLVNMLNSSLIAETWGRPLEEPWCDPNLPVSNIRKVAFDNKIQWLQTKDHSKWTYAIDSDFACFGDMNRMTSQWKRGGAFYCIKSQNLKGALVAITNQVSDCSSSNNNGNIGKLLLILGSLASVALFLKVFKLNI